MAGMWGYRSYRGRTPKWKIVLAVLLVLVILAAICVIFLQQHIVYDETGTPHLEVPWRETPEEESTQEPGQVEVTIQKPERLEEIYAFPVPVGVLTREGWKEAWTNASLMSAPPYNAAVFTVKDSAGNVYMDSTAAVPGAVEAGEDTQAALEEMTDPEVSSFYTIARISCFHDPKAANSDAEGMGLKNTGGYLFYDGNNSQWLDPGKPEARQYLCEIAKEAAALGFEEILLTDVGCPTEGKLDKIAYTGAEPLDEQVLLFLQEVKDALEPYGVALSVELPEEVISQGIDEAAGLCLTKIAPLADRIYAETAPEGIEALTQAVSAASGTTAFVAEVEEHTPEIHGSCLVYLDESL